MSELCCRCNLPKQPPKTSSESAFRYICRLCLMRAEDTEPIFIHPGDNSLANKIFACTGVQVEENAAVGPTSICMSCKTSVYKSYQFFELCQRNNKIIKNLLASQQRSSESTGNELRMVIRTGGANQMPTVKHKRTNSGRKSTRSNLEESTSASDVSWSENDDEKDDDGDDDAEEVLPIRQLAYETDTQEESPKRKRLSLSVANKVPSLVIPLARLNGAICPSPSSEGSAGGTSRASTIEPIRSDDLFNCEFCDGSFPYAIQIRQHIDLYHTDKKHELTCKFCSKSFFTSAELNKHKAEKHVSDGVIECKLCQRFFASPQGLHQHYRSIIHRAATGEAVFPRRRNSCMTYGYVSPVRRTSVSSDYGSDYPSSGGGNSRRKSTQFHNVLDDFNPYDSSCYDEITTYKCDYCDERFDDKQSLARHTDVRPCRVELEPLNLDLLLERMDLDELLMPLNNIPDVTIIEPPIEIVDLT
ncbi:zinc finger protein 652-like [Ochlerotatus camptorhynchus]|uniref:zinc finger protein 652-like n=1 Tax=Ochlerotatus camptorhynchus TaxID=644619 RepID=UPI0031DBA5B5